MPHRSFITFHIVLGLGLLVLSLQTFWHAVGPGAGRPDLHAMLLATVEAVGSILFLIPGSVRFGAGLLLLALVIAFAIHARLGQWRPDLVIYSAGVWLVAAKGDSGGKGPGA